MAKRKAKRRARKKSLVKGIFRSFFLGIGYIVTAFMILVAWLARAVFMFAYWLYHVTFGGKGRDALRRAADSKGVRKLTTMIKRDKDVRVVLPTRIRVVETMKGSFESFWTKLYKADSLIGIIIGARGSGKSGIALCLAESLRDSREKFFAMGFSRKDLPKWINVVDKVDELENDSFVVIDEGGILFNSRDSMSSSNKMLSELLFIARHKNLTILFVSQNSSNLEINTLRQADFIILKKGSLLQKSFERKIISDIYEEYSEKFHEYRRKKGVALIYADNFLGFVDNELPSFWSENVSKGFR